MTRADSPSWTPGTPERAAADVVAAFNARDAEALARVATPDSLRAYAARQVGGSGRPGEVRRDDSVKDEQTISILESALHAIPREATGTIICAALGHVLEGPAVAHVVFRLLHTDEHGATTPISPAPEIATAERIGGEWRIILDEWAIAGVPGFRDAIWFVDRSSGDERAG